MRKLLTVAILGATALVPAQTQAGTDELCNGVLRPHRPGVSCDLSPPLSERLPSDMRPGITQPGNPASGDRRPLPSDTSWRVPFVNKSGMIVTTTVNDKFTVTWLLDTGASISSIPYDLAMALGAREIRKMTFTLADGRKSTESIVLIDKLMLGPVQVLQVEAAVGGKDTTPLLGKNYLDRFSSYEIDNKSAQLVLRK